MAFTYTATLCYVINNSGEVLLQLKSKGFGQGKWNGPGGKVDKEESVKESVKREVREETGITIKNIKKMAELEFVFVGNEEANNYTHVFICYNWEGEPEDKGEGELRWFKIEDMPLDKMWDDDKYWLKPLLRGEYMHRRFYFNKEGRVLKYKDIET